MRSLTVLIIAALAGAGCQSGRHSTSGFRLPPDGNAERGKVAFVAHKCHNCHSVADVDLPQPEKGSPEPVALGGQVASAMPDSHLFTSIAYPAYKSAKGARLSMPSHAETMTLRETIDIIEFLQAHYRIREVPRAAYY